jgi:hypothetical protein
MGLWVGMTVCCRHHGYWAHMVTRVTVGQCKAIAVALNPAESEKASCEMGLQLIDSWHSAWRCRDGIEP